MLNFTEIGNISLECPKCSHTEFDGPTQPKDSDYLICGACGKTRTFAELKAANTDKTKKFANQPETKTRAK